MVTRTALLVIVRQLAHDATRRAADARATLQAAQRTVEEADDAATKLAALVSALEAEPEPNAPSTWRERLWTVPAEVRLSAAEAAEALGVSRSFLYHDAESPSPRVPHRRNANGGPVYVAGELRSYIAQDEVLALAGTMASAAVPVVRRLRNRRGRYA